METTAPTGNVVKILFLASDPSNASRLRLGSELKEIRKRLEGNPNFELKDEPAVMPNDVIQTIIRNKPQIVHFSGHGLDTGELCFEDEQGMAKPIPPEALSALFKQVTNHVKCVIVNTCFSDRQANAIAQYIPAVIGTRMQIGDKAAICFSTGFYTALEPDLTQESIKRAYEMGRVSIQFGDSPGEHVTPTLIFGAPELRFSAEVDAALSGVSNTGSTEVLILKRVLNVKGKKMNLDTATVSQIIEDKLQKVREYNSQLTEFETTLTEALRDEFPLSEETKRALVSYHNELELRPEDVKAVENRILNDPKWDSAEVWYDRGRIQSTLNNYEQALEYFTKAIEKKQEYSGAYHERGYCHQKLGQYEQAISNYTKAIQTNKSWEAANNLSGAYFERGYVYYNYHSNDELKREECMTQALADWTKTLELSPKYGAAYYNRALVHEFFNKYTEAIQDYENALEHNYPPKNNERVKVLYRLARMYSNSGNETRAQELTQDAINLLYGNNNKEVANGTDVLESELDVS